MEYFNAFVYVAYVIIAICMLYMGFVLFGEVKTDIKTRIENYKKSKGVNING